MCSVKTSFIVLIPGRHPKGRHERPDPPAVEQEDVRQRPRLAQARQESRIFAVSHAALFAPRQAGELHR